MSDDYWFEQRYMGMYYDLHGHAEGQRDVECSLCAPQPSRDDEAHA